MRVKDPIPELILCLLSAARAFDNESYAARPAGVVFSWLGTDFYDLQQVAHADEVSAYSLLPSPATRFDKGLSVCKKLRPLWRLSRIQSLFGLYTWHTCTNCGLASSSFHLYKGFSIECHRFLKTKISWMVTLRTINALGNSGRAVIRTLTCRACRHEPDFPGDLTENMIWVSSSSQPKLGTRKRSLKWRWPGW